MSVRRIKKNDIVQVRVGVHAGKTGKVIDVLAGGTRALVEGVNIVKKGVKKTQQNPRGGFVDKEAPLRLEKLAPYCPRCKKGVRVKRVKDGERSVRKCVKCSHAFE